MILFVKEITSFVFVQDSTFTSESLVAFYSYDDVNINVGIVAKSSGCMIGVGSIKDVCKASTVHLLVFSHLTNDPIFQNENLQSSLHETRNRVILLVNDKGLDVTNITILEKHHPIMVLEDSDSSAADNHLTLKTVCKGPSGEFGALSLFGQNGWTPNPKIDPMTLEKSCNFGHHPLYGKDMVVAAYSVSPFLIIDDDSNIEGGVSHEIVKVLAEYFNFKYIPEVVVDYFVFHANGTVGGSLGEVNGISH